MAYTHKFEIEVGELDIEGEFEFVEGKMRHKFDSLPEGLTLEESTRLTECLRSIQSMYDSFGEIVKVEFKEK